MLRNETKYRKFGLEPTAEDSQMIAEIFLLGGNGWQDNGVTVIERMSIVGGRLSHYAETMLYLRQFQVTKYSAQKLARSNLY